MKEGSMANKVQREEEVQKWVELLRSSVVTERLKGAMELASLGVRTRGAIRTRGTISKPASSKIPAGVNFSAVMEAFKDQHFEVRREVAFVLGEWADETAVKVLSKIAKTDPETVVRHEAVRALGKIGGPTAVEVLTELAQRASDETIRWRAIKALGELALAETEKPEDKKQPEGVRTRGAIRTRGISSLRDVSEEAKKVLDLLEKLRHKDPSDFVRDLTSELLEGQSE
jgi:hypothetical protein